MLRCCRYGGEHAAPELQKEAVYGLTEINRSKISNARLVANPGCYPTSVQLALYPLLQQGLILKDDIIIDSKSGQQRNSLCTCNATISCSVVIQTGLHAVQAGSEPGLP